MEKKQFHPLKKKNNIAIIQNVEKVKRSEYFSNALYIQYSTSQKFGHTYSSKGFSLFLLFSTLYNNSEDFKTMK